MGEPQPQPSMKPPAHRTRRQRRPRRGAKTHVMALPQDPADSSAPSGDPSLPAGSPGPSQAPASPAASRRALLRELEAQVQAAYGQVRGATLTEGAAGSLSLNRGPRGTLRAQARRRPGHTPGHRSQGVSRGQGEPHPTSVHPKPPPQHSVSPFSSCDKGQG